MKKLLLIFSCIALLSCDWAKTVEYISTHINHYKNESGYDIKIYSYKKGKKYYHQIPNNNTLTEKWLTELTESEEYNKMITYSDSIQVIFNNSRYHKWGVNGNTSFRSPFNVNNLKLIKNGTRYSEYQFTFTPQDYDDALPCNGNCD
ncbi:hypothetical protein [Bergeyella zoohelcum]|uniref:hypothetical protein n=1 Tax=Bergeyella zoohelcum TaxID=1015 RepID=UPI002A91377D|nr:hypothetical protein [Bergeyella zoohelcum]MDY6024747.1 hypothetical protein [Bergeyella zoohelcum]